MSLLDAASRPGAGVDESAKALESLVLRGLLKASGAFRPSETAGGGIRADLFVEALADAVADAGGLGLGKAIAASLPGAETPPTTAPNPTPPVPAPLPSELDTLALVAGPGRITSGFGRRIDPFHGGAAGHRGVDVGAPEGSPILAAAEGVVRRAGARGGYGLAVEVDHGDGTSTLYAHASALLVREGERVARGQPIARVGATGRATGAHLHFELRVNDRPVEPGRALRIYGERVDVGGEAIPDPRRRAP